MHANDVNYSSFYIPKDDTFYYPYSLNIYCNPNVVKDLDHLISVADKKILLWSIECLQEDFLHNLLDHVWSKDLINRIVWLLQPSHRYSSDLLSLFGDDLFLIDSDLINLNLHLNESHTSIPNFRWNPTTGRFLFPTGKPDRPNRIPLLYKFYTNDLLDQCDWSLFVNDHTRAKSRKLLSNLDDIEFEKFIDQHNRNLDDIEIYHCTPDSNHSNGYPFDGNLYQRSSFRVISETMMESHPIISEKTWITMINRMPFIMTGYAGNLTYLRESGYRTFENYLPIPDYDLIQDTESRLDAAIENTKFWLENIHNQADEIEKDVQHNYQLLCENIEKNLRRAKELAMVLDEPKRSIYSLAPLSIEQQRWVSFYYGVKDPTWPDCLLEEDFKKLPSRIRRECVQQFGYQPKNNH